MIDDPIDETDFSTDDPDELAPAEADDRWLGFDPECALETIDTELPVFSSGGHVVFPGAIVPLLASSRASRAVIDEALAGNRMIVVATPRSADGEGTRPEQLHERATAARILKMLKYPDGSVRVLVKGLSRVAIDAFVATAPFLRAEVTTLVDVDDGGPETGALMAAAVQCFSHLVEASPALPADLQVAVVGLRTPGRVADLIGSSLALSIDEKHGLLAMLEVSTRLREVLSIIERESALIDRGRNVHGGVRARLESTEQELDLRRRLAALRRELGEEPTGRGEADGLRGRLEEAGLPPDARAVADRELDRLATMAPESAEHPVVRTYLERLADIPWSVATSDNLDIQHARAVLDEDHFGLEKVKERILEFLAVRRLRAEPRGPILCLVGPPGVGKTSLGRSIARALGRRFHRLALGGVRDEAEIRGHRRTYVGALPGRIVQGITAAGSLNPLFMLDEIDKLGADFRGDPASALLEVLDPEQNGAFRDHYLEVPLDLSRVMFLTTANYLDPIPAALADRMEVLELPGYCEEEKLRIARGHLVPRQVEENGLDFVGIDFDDSALGTIIRNYTKESGLRNLEREIGAVCRKIARAVSESGAHPPSGEKTRDDMPTRVRVAPEDVRRYLGAPRYLPELAERELKAGVAVGLAWTPQGGDILFVEAARMRGDKRLTLTGQLGDVMKESAEAALTYLRSNGEAHGIAGDFFESSDIHVHVPAGAIPKDGPSAGATIVAALASALTGRPLRERTASTGEITLRGAVLPVGGIKEKVLAARRAGISTVVVPALNDKDVAEVPIELRMGLEFRYVANVEDLLAAMFDRSTEPVAATG